MADGDQQGAVKQGSRWLYEEPTEGQVKEWFESQPLHRGMSHGPYFGGIVLIPQEEKYKSTRRKANGDTCVVELERAAFTPYVKVETRISYFWDYLFALNGGNPKTGDFVGVIEPVEQRRVTDERSPWFNGQLPEGFFVYAVRQGNETVKRFVGCEMRAAIYERQSYHDMLNGKRVIPVLSGRGVKQVPTNYRGQQAWADESVLMKAETGAKGRALGAAGILVVGTGIATAEDVQEAVSGPGGGGTSGEPVQGALPPVVDREGAPVQGEPEGGGGQVQAEQVDDTPESPEQADAHLREHAVALRTELERDFPQVWAAYVEWYTGQRNFPPLDQLTGPALKGAVTKLERDLDAAKNPQQA